MVLQNQVIITLESYNKSVAKSYSFFKDQFKCFLVCDTCITYRKVFAATRVLSHVPYIIVTHTGR